MQNEAIGCYAQPIIVIGSGKSRHCQALKREWQGGKKKKRPAKNRVSLVVDKENLQRKQGESSIKLRNLQILDKMLEKSSQFLSSENSCEATKPGRRHEHCKSWKSRSENMRLQSTSTGWRPFDSSFEWKERWWGGNSQVHLRYRRPLAVGS